MLKRLLNAVTTFALLCGCYFVYVRAFAVVVEQLRATKKSEGTKLVAHDSRSKLEAISIAKKALGPQHWSGDPELAYRYYNAERGFWMYAKQVWRIGEEGGVKYDGKRLRMAPFALVTRSRDGKVTKTIESDEAVFDLSESLTLNVSSEGESLKIKHARIEKNVLIRDDRGTPGLIDDDMTIGPLSTMEFDEATHKIESPSDIVIQDRDIRITGKGLRIKLREEAQGQPGGGFGGAETAYLLENVHVVMRDVGKSGILPGSSDPKRPGAKAAAVGVDPATGTAQVAASPAKAEPTPLDVRCDGTMRVDLPPPVAKVEVGPPQPPPPTHVFFERNVVVLRGLIDKGPDQLTCDALRLTMVPPDNSAAGVSPVRETAKAAAAPPLEQAKSAVKPQSPPAEPGPAQGDDQGVFGNLTLQRAHATGHAVWLLLPTSGVKLRCNELIHKKLAPYRPDETYFRGDFTRPLELEKVDVERKEGHPELDQVTGVTHIWTVDATLFDDGAGLDSADVVAHGPGRLETRPDRDKPVERIAVWQDKLVLLNETGPDGAIEQKIIDLTGNRPCFIDKLQESTLDSGRLIKVWLKPKPPEIAHALDGQTADPKVTPTSLTVTRDDAPKNPPADTSSGLGLGGGGFRIDRLLAFRDAHLTAPGKKLTARSRLDAEFIEEKPPKPPPAPAQGAPAEPTASETPAPTEGDEQAPGEPAEPPAAEPPPRPVVGSAERIWAKVATLPDAPGPVATPPAELAKTSPQPAIASSATTTPPRSSAGGLGSRSEVRKVWMFGDVALHQDPEPGRTQGDEVYGEAVYLENPGPNKAITHVYQRDPTEDPPRPGPLPLAWVLTDERSIKGEVIRINQATDQAWVDGPGTSTQLTARAFLSDKAPDPEEEAGGDEPSPSEKTPSNRDGASPAPSIRTTAPPSPPVLSTADPDPRTATKPKTAADESPTDDARKPKTRAGKALSPKAPFTITWTKNMEFLGRSKDLDGNKAGKAIFYGRVRADMEDGVLQCEDHMITYTDREVPLAKLNSLSRAAGARPDPAGAEPEPSPELALIECFGKAVAINRKVDPLSPIELERQMIQGDYLRYDRRTGEFYVPGSGWVHLYEREKKEGDDAGLGGDRPAPASASSARTVVPTSGRSDSQPVDRPAAKKSRKTAKKSEPDKPEIPSLVLTQIKFTTGMRGRFGVGNADDSKETRWSEFFGDVETARARVPDVRSFLKPDKLPADGFFLTGQTMRVITEPPPVGSPPSTPARNYLKAWEKAYVWNSDKTLQADVVTYDSYKDLIYAYGENGRGVVFAQQYAVGQPAAPSYARAVQLNPKTGGSHLIDASTLQSIDQRTGVRPTRLSPPGPTEKAKKKKKAPFKVPSNNYERRGFTGL